MTIHAACPHCRHHIRMEVTEGALSFVGDLTARVLCNFCFNIWDQTWKHWELREQIIPDSRRETRRVGG